MRVTAEREGAGFVGGGVGLATVGREAASLAPGVDLPRAAAAVRELLLAIGEDPDREGLIETPRRVAKAFAEMTRGLREDAGVALGRVFEQEAEEAVVLRGIEFHSLCEHHLLPFVGRAAVAYLPSGGKVVGLSKLARTVDTFARRPQMQERMTQQIADALSEHLQPRGVAVLVEGEHYCMKMRGVNKQGATMVTTAFRGVFKHDPARRAEVLNQLQWSGVDSGARPACTCGH